MSKSLFTTEFEVNASPKVLYPYLSTASGLSQWFADDVNVDSDKVYDFFFDGEHHKATLEAQKQHSHVRFQFVPNGDAEDGDEPSYFELRLEMSDLTRTTYLAIKDFSAEDDHEELEEVWGSLVDDLKQIVGG